MGKAFEICVPAAAVLVAGNTMSYRMTAGQIISSLIPAPEGAGLLEDVIPPTLCFTAKSRRLFACAKSFAFCCICCLKTAVFNVDKIRKGLGKGMTRRAIRADIEETSGAPVLTYPGHLAAKLRCGI